MRVFNRLKEDKGEFIKTLQENIEKVLSRNGSNIDIEALEKHIEEVKGDMHQLVQLKIKGQIAEQIYNEEYAGMEERLDELQQEKAKYDAEIIGNNDYKNRVEEIIATINVQDGLLEQFNDEIFSALVEKIKILEPTHFVFVLKNGMEIEEKFEFKKVVVSK